LRIGRPIVVCVAPFGLPLHLIFVGNLISATLNLLVVGFLSGPELVDGWLTFSKL